MPRLLAHKSQHCRWQHQTSHYLLLASHFCFLFFRLCTFNLSSLMTQSRSHRGRASMSNPTQQETARTVSISDSRSRGRRGHGRLPHQRSGGSTSQVPNNSHARADPTEEASSSTGSRRSTSINPPGVQIVATTTCAVCLNDLTSNGHRALPVVPGGWHLCR